ncbi:MAG: SRPBCC family protein [Dermatophilaceae bacterium]
MLAGCAPSEDDARHGQAVSVTRSTTIDVPAERVRSLVDDFHEWPAWSPWEGLDPGMRRTYSGAERSVGASYAWEGNRKAGKGGMTITADAPERVDVDLRFEKPFRADNRIEFILTPAGGSTAVEWRMHGELSPVMRAFSMVKSMDSLVGPDFEKGLAQLKRVAESD